jgi:enediyne biosynthesis protein E4
LSFALSTFSCAAPSRPPGASPVTDVAWFVDRAEETGLTFVHVNGMSGKLYYAEIIAPGAALFDYDQDGDLDVYFVQGRSLGAPAGEPPSQRSGSPRQGSPDQPASGGNASPAPGASGGRLFRNDLAVNADGSRTLHFTDVTGASGIKATGYGMGVAAADFNNDGCVDLFLTSLGPYQGFRNNCDGTFTDVSRSLAAPDSRSPGGPDSVWSVSATFFDFDRDGWLDLFVGHYLDYRIEGNTPCFSPSGRPDYCSPNVYRPQASRLYHNNRDGTFADVTLTSGLSREFGPALGVVAADFNGDHWIDLYVANDGQPNQLWSNQRDGTFKSIGLLSGSAMNAHGKAKAGMGVDAGDFDNDGDEDLFVTNLRGEGSDLYVNDGSGLFETQSERSGLGFASLPYTGFGTAWIDVDNDGRLEILSVNGAVHTVEALSRENDPFPLREGKLLFHSLGSGRFEDVTRRAGAVFQMQDVSRGAAFGDVDNDGDADVLVANNNGKPRLLINQIGARNHWIGLRLAGKAGRDMLGARVAVFLDDGSVLWRRARADGSYASANDPRVLAGLGRSSKPARVRVTWPGGESEEWAGVPVDRYTTLTEGSGK